MPARETVIAEGSPSKVVATFDSETQAREVADALRDRFGLGPEQVTIAAPGQRDPGRRVEPDQAGIARTGVRSHLVLGAAGGGVGIAVFTLLLLLGVRAVVASPVAAAAVIVALGIVFGMLLGGLVTLRPDHDRAIQRVHEAVDSGRYAVIAHAGSAGERERLAAFLDAARGEPTQTL